MEFEMSNGLGLKFGARGYRVTVVETEAGKNGTMAKY
jgi:hypothetical protein